VPDMEVTGLSLEGGRVAGLQGRDAKSGEAVSVLSKAVVVATGGFNSNLEWCSNSIPGSATTKSWKDRGAARREADTSSSARRAAISPTWTTSGSTSTPRPITAIQ